MPGILILIFFVITGILTGLNVIIPYSYSQYIAVAILACLDSVFGAFSANIEKKFRMNIFLSGFFGNAIIAMFLVYIGSKLNVDIYLAAVIVFTGRLLINFTAIRRDVIEQLYYKKKDKSSDKNKEKNKEKKKRIKSGETSIVKEEETTPSKEHLIEENNE